MAPSIARRDVVLTGIALATSAATAGLATRLTYAQAAEPGRLAPIPSRYPAPSSERALKIANLNELEEEASRVLPRGGFAYIAAGSTISGRCTRTVAHSIDTFFAPST